MIDWQIVDIRKEIGVTPEPGLWAETNRLWNEVDPHWGVPIEGQEFAVAAE